MSDRITPFGISALSKSNKSIAYNNEIMCNKQTGEILVKSPKGDTISYNYFSRLRTMIDSLTIAAEHHNAIGEIYTISPDNVEIPSDIPNLINSAMNITNPDVKGFIICADVNLIFVEPNTISTHTTNKVFSNYDVIYEYIDGSIETVHKHMLLDDMIGDYVRIPDNVKSFSISDIFLSVDESVTTEHIIILNNALIFIEKDIE